eukprot:231903-Pyramimonas_sp.AAC.1
MRGHRQRIGKHAPHLHHLRATRLNVSRSPPAYNGAPFLRGIRQLAQGHHLQVEVLAVVDGRGELAGQAPPR